MGFYMRKAVSFERNEGNLICISFGPLFQSLQDLTILWLQELTEILLCAIPVIFPQNTVKMFACFTNYYHFQLITFHFRTTDNEPWPNKMNPQPQHIIAYGTSALLVRQGSLPGFVSPQQAQQFKTHQTIISNRIRTKSYLFFCILFIRTPEHQVHLQCCW